MDPYNPHPHVHGNVHPHVHHHVQAMNVLHALPIAAVAAPALLLAPDQQHNREHIDFLRREAVALEASAKRLRDLANVLENGGEIDTDGTSLTITTRGLVGFMVKAFRSNFLGLFQFSIFINC